MASVLKPCPVCKGPPTRFNLQIKGASFDVIHCPKGCKPNWNSSVVHLRSCDVPEWDDVGDAWNTMQTRIDDDGLMRVSFDAFPPHKMPVQAEGPFNHWPKKTQCITNAGTKP